MRTYDLVLGQFMICHMIRTVILYVAQAQIDSIDVAMATDVIGPAEIIDQVTGTNEGRRTVTLYVLGGLKGELYTVS